MKTLRMIGLAVVLLLVAACMDASQPLTVEQSPLEPRRATVPAAILASQIAQLVPADAAVGDAFGISVSISDNAAVVGAPHNDDFGDRSGSAYVFRWTGTSWVQEAKLLPNDGESVDFFGQSVAISGDVAVVAAPGDNNSGVSTGSVYVFRRIGASWVQEQKLLSSDGAGTNSFGGSIATSGDVVLVGAPGDDENGSGSGSVYVFRNNGSTWVKEQKLLASDGSSLNLFGSSVAVSGGVALIGAWQDDDNGIGSGSAYVFRNIGTTWVQEQKLLPADDAVGRFGRSVAISGDVALVGAPVDDGNAALSGTAYIFRNIGSAWVQEQKILAADGTTGDRFGWSVAVSRDLALVGTPSDGDNGDKAGSVYLFRRSGTTWAQEQKLLGQEGDEFGVSLSIDGGLALIGASNTGLFTGSTYVYQLMLSSTDPVEGLDNLIGDVAALGPGGNGTLNKGQTDALSRKLEQVQKLLSMDKTSEALAVLADFRQQVLDLEADGVLSTGQRAALVASVDSIMNLIGAT